MRNARTTACVALFITALLPALVRAQASISKVAIANPVKIFNDIAETNDLKARMQSDQKNIEAEELRRRTQLNDLKAQRDALKPDSPQYAEKNKALLDASIQYEVWGRLTNMEIQRQQKQQIKTLYDKIRSAIAEVAVKKNIELVLAEQGIDLPADLEQINMDQLKVLINQRNVLYNTALVDISADVVATMDLKYKSGAK
jgi:Skp family chaperone for outer membrane proteins